MGTIYPPTKSLIETVIVEVAGSLNICGLIDKQDLKSVIARLSNGEPKWLWLCQ